ncbi:unnamed protein product [Rotaria sp. Silwood2]|nr:unnamed protein product [Rotaria sp. Silwood2]CAF4354047.1 unnamed protein product [Rotaria sp. Silwood2]
MNLFSQHTSVSLSINENGIPDVHIGMKIILNKFALEDNSYEQLDEREDDLPAHAKCSLLGSSMNIPIISRRLVFGTWSGAHLWEQRNCAGSQSIVVIINKQKEKIKKDSFENSLFAGVQFFL